MLTRPAEDERTFALLVVALPIAVIAWLSYALGISFEVAAQCLGTTLPALGLVHGAAYLASGSLSPGPIRITASLTALWASWIPAMADKANKVAHIDPAWGVMPYNHLPFYGQSWFQYGGAFGLLAVTVVLVIRR